MFCYRCRCDDTKVLESRAGGDGLIVRRRRECRSCGFRFTTYEKVEEVPIQVRKKAGYSEPYNRSKLLRSVQIACRKRSFSPEHIEQMVCHTEQRLEDLGRNVITSEEVGDMIMARLADEDPVAYIRFASVYKDFQTLSQFEDIIRGLRQGGGSTLAEDVSGDRAQPPVS